MLPVPMISNVFSKGDPLPVLPTNLVATSGGMIASDIVRIPDWLI